MTQHCIYSKSNSEFGGGREEVEIQLRFKLPRFHATGQLGRALRLRAVPANVWATNVGHSTALNMFLKVRASYLRAAW